jgi:hypothetical protein
MLRVMCACLWLCVGLAGCADTWVQCEQHLVPINPLPAAKGNDRQIIRDSEPRKGAS